MGIDGTLYAINTTSFMVPKLSSSPLFNYVLAVVAVVIIMILVVFFVFRRKMLKKTHCLFRVKSVRYFS